MEHRSHDELINEFKDFSNKIWMLALEADKFKNSIVLSILSRSGKGTAHLIDEVLDCFGYFEED